MKIMKYRQENSILSGSNFSKISDIVFSEFISKEDYIKKNLGKNIVLYEEKNFLLYQLLNFEIYENSVIFCNTHTLKSLFKHLYKINNLRNIKLITHQTDIEINEKLFKLKPKCISEWYSTNVSYDDKSLIPIPLGVGNNFQKNQINSSSKIKDITISDINLTSNLYLNFKISTNFSERLNLYDYFSDKTFTKIDEPKLSLNEYMDAIHKSSFVLSPWGNGIDTHRIWEALYLGKVPITKFHQNFSSFSNLPILFVDNYFQINEGMLNTFIKKFPSNSYSLDMLDLGYWHKKINLIKIDDDQLFISNQSLLFGIIYKFRFNISKVIKSKYKIFKFYLRQLKKIPKKFF